MFNESCGNFNSSDCNRVHNWPLKKWCQSCKSFYYAEYRQRSEREKETRAKWEVQSVEDWAAQKSTQKKQ